MQPNDSSSRGWQAEISRTWTDPSLIVPLAISTALLVGLFLLSRANALVFHSIAEIFSITIAFSLFVLAWNARGYMRGGYLLVIGVGLGLVGVIDVLHTLAYKGMGVFPGSTTNEPTQLWLAARYLQSGTFLAAALVVRRRVNLPILVSAFTAVTLLLLLLIYPWRLFPTAHVDGLGLTPFKIISEYVIIGLHILAWYLLWRSRGEIDPQVFNLLTGAFVFAILAEAAFTQYIGVFDFANQLGHFFKILAFFLIYKALFETGFLRPYNLLFLDLKQREEALARSEARLRRLVDSNVIGVIFSHADGRINDANEAFLEMMHLDRTAVSAGGLRWDDLTPPEYLPLDAAAIQEADTTGACTPFENEYQRPDGSRVPVLIGVARLDDVNTREYVAFVVDLTQRKQAEAAMADYAERLEQSNRELQNFAFVASHDLQEPLRKIHTFGERLKSQAAEQLNPDQHDYLDRMIGAAGRMRRMIQDLLSLSRVTTQGQPFEPVDLNAVAAEILSDLEIQIERSGGQVTIDPLATIDADPLQMHQLLQNLIGNGLKFARPEVPPVVTVRCRCGKDNHGDTVILTVRDNGIGFDEQYLERIFQPFQRLHGQGAYEGSGMGLAICRRIVERHQGHITAHSVLGQGSTFEVALPVHHSVSER